MHKVTILTLERALASSVTITIDVLEMANRISARENRPVPFSIRIVGQGSALFRPFLISPESIHQSPTIMIVPALGFSRDASIRERMGQSDVEEAGRLVRAAYDDGAHIASSCTGTLLLAREGLLNDRNVTTAWWLAPTFAKLFPKVQLNTSELILTDGPITTAGAAMAQMDLMVGLVARYAGTGIAEACARRMLLDERRSQTPYMAVGLVAASDANVSKAATWARARLDQPISVGDLAAAVGQSPRTFARRVTAATGLPPVQFLQQLRLERAVELLESTTNSFEEISYRVGYSDSSTLRLLIRRGFGMSPRDLRARARKTRLEQFAPNGMIALPA